MPTNTLTDNQCRAAKAGEKDRKLFDGHGLHLFVTTKGAKVWRVAYRWYGKPQTKVLGPYPLLSLAEARQKRDELRKQLLNKEDPKADAKLRKTITLRQAWAAYWGGREDLTEGYRTDAVNGLEKHLGPKLGDRPIGTITREELLEVLMVMDAAKLYTYVRTIRMWVSQVFEWAHQQDKSVHNVAAEIDPAKAFGRRQRKNHAALRLQDVPEFMTRLSLEPDLQSVLACRLMAYTWVRTGELRYFLWEELEAEDLWCVPAGKMKRKREHLVPLPRQALPLLRVLKARSGGSRWVFPSEHDPKRPMSENAVLALIYRMGYKGDMTGHGWRAVGSTWANENGYNPDAIERQLAHVPEDKTRAAYNRAEYIQARRQILQAWADWLDSCNAGGAQGRPIPAHGLLSDVDVRFRQSALLQPAPHGLAADVQSPLELAARDHVVGRGS
jgi:integrase